MTRKPLWAWIMRHTAGSTIIDTSSGASASASIIGSDHAALQVWLFDAKRARDHPSFSNINGLYASLHYRDNKPYLTVRIRERGSPDNSSTGLLLYEGPLEATDADLLAFWSKLIADRLTDDEKP